MVLYYQNLHSFPYEFKTATLAYFNRYPNPYAKHVLSVDTVDTFIDEEGRLHQTKLVVKSGRLPQWVKPFLGKISTSMVIEKSIVDPKNQTMSTYQSNIDHKKIIKVEEFNNFYYDDVEKMTKSLVKVKFSSGFKLYSVKNRIEEWSFSKFGENIKKSREGLKFVMDQIRARMKVTNAPTAI